MMRILFCDDDETFLHILMERTGEILRGMGIEAELTGCQSGEEAMRCLGLMSQNAQGAHNEQAFPNEQMDEMRQTPFDALFLDIDMPGVSGFEIAERVEQMKNREKPVIVFISQMEHLVYESFSYRPFWFLRKSDLGQLQKLLEGLMKTATGEKYIFSLKYNGRTISLQLKDILYFESDRHYVTLYTISDDYRYKASIGEIAKELEPHYFMRCHVGFLVNCRHISVIKRGQLYLQSGKSIPVSRSRQQEAERGFMKYIDYAQAVR